MKKNYVEFAKKKNLVGKNVTYQYFKVNFSSIEHDL
jgi:hypothetical protein